jgi:hypothetical protein
VTDTATADVMPRSVGEEIHIHPPTRPRRSAPHSELLPS